MIFMLLYNDNRISRLNIDYADNYAINSELFLFMMNLF